MTKRTERLSSEFRKEIAAILSGPLKDREPALSGLISVTEADVAPDLKTAKVYVSVYAADPSVKKSSFEIIPRSHSYPTRALNTAPRWTSSLQS